MILNVNQRNEFANLIVVSRLADRRRALCLQIGVNPNTLDFVNNRLAFDFAIELIADCEEKELNDVLIRLLKLVTKELRDNKSYQLKIAELHEVLSYSPLSTEGFQNEPPVLPTEQYNSVSYEDESIYTDSHIVSFMYTWSPMVIIWMFLLLLSPTRYEKLVRRFRASSARNIHISLGCLLAYLPLLIIALGVDLYYESNASEINWAQILWLTVSIVWLTTMIIGRFDRDEIGDLIGLFIGILTTIIVGIATPIISFDFSLALLSGICISFTGGTAYAIALDTINDRNVHGAGIGAASSAVLGSLLLVIFTDYKSGAILVILTVIGAMAVAKGVESGLEENFWRMRISKRSVFTLFVFFSSLTALCIGFINGGLLSLL